MSTPNPLNPQGSPLEQSARRKTLPYVVALFAAFHVLALGGLLFLGCSPEKPAVTPPAIGANDQVNPSPVDPIPAPVAPVEPVVSQPGPSQPVASAPSTPSAPVSLPPITPESAAAGEYKIRAGDNAYVIAKARGISAKALIDANPNLDWKHLKVNQMIQLPAATPENAAVVGGTGAGAQANLAAAGGELGSNHEVKQGDTLMRIGKKYGVSVKAIRTANGLKSDSIFVGQKLKIPARTSAATGSAPASEPVAIPVSTQPK